MGGRTKILVAFSILLLMGGVIAWQWDSIQRAYYLHVVRALTKDLPKCDRVEVFHLRGGLFTHDESERPKPGEGFPIRAYGDAEAWILNRTTLKGAGAEALAALWRAQRFDWELQKLCHAPVYGFRFYAGSKLLFETSVCFQCSNFYVTTSRRSSWWGFDSESPQAQALLSRLQQIFPASVPKRR